MKGLKHNVKFQCKQNQLSYSFHNGGVFSRSTFSIADSSVQERLPINEPSTRNCESRSADNLKGVAARLDELPLSRQFFTSQLRFSLFYLGLSWEHGVF
jgi:hypothetical protein